MDEKQYKELSAKLDNITKLLAVMAVKDEEKEQDKIELLDMVGLRPSEIARLLNKSPQNISTVLGNLRKKREVAPEASIPDAEVKPTQGEIQAKLGDENK